MGFFQVAKSVMGSATVKGAVGDIATGWGKSQAGGTFGTMATGAVAGIMGTQMSTGDKNFGSYVKGAALGAAGGYAASRVSGTIGHASYQMARRGYSAATKAGNSAAAGSWKSIRQGIAGARQQFGNAAGRRATWAAGGMLSGAAFGGMFGGNRNNRSRGFNRSRGNRF